MKQNHSPSSGAERPIPPERSLCVAEVRKTTPIMPHMQRITLASTALMDFPVRRPAQWVKLFVPTPESKKPNGRAYRRGHLRAFAQHVEVADDEVRIMGRKSDLLQTLVAASSVETAAFAVHSSVLKWRTRQDSNL